MVIIPSLHHVALNVTLATTRGAEQKLALAGYSTRKPRDGANGGVFDLGANGVAKMFPIELADDGQPSPASWNISAQKDNTTCPIIEILTPNVETVTAILVTLGFIKVKGKLTNGSRVSLNIQEGPPALATRWHVGFSFRSVGEILTFRDGIPTGSPAAVLKSLLPERGKPSDFRLIKIPSCIGMSVEIMWGLTGGQRAHGYPPDTSSTRPVSIWEQGGKGVTRR